MELPKANNISLQNHAFLAIHAAVAIGIVLLATHKFGAGLSPDSVGYIAGARNMVDLGIYTNFQGIPIISWPPLYSAVLASIYLVLQIDPLLSAAVVNAFLFGGIVSIGGLLALNFVTDSPIRASILMLMLIFSKPLFAASIMAWSEILFTCLTLLSFVFLFFYFERRDLLSLLLFALLVALSCLTRYIGVTLILWGALAITSFHREALRNKVAHVLLFVLISGFPLGLWLARNHAISGSFFGARAASTYSIFQNIGLTFDSILHWYVHYLVTDHRIILVVIGIIITLVAAPGIKGNWHRFKSHWQQFGSVALFIVVYMAFLIVSSTTTAYDPIGDRLLSPVYVPLTFLSLTLAFVVVDYYRKQLADWLIKPLAGMAMAFLLVGPALYTIGGVVHLIANGEGYSGKAWLENQTARYLHQDGILKDGCAIYSNGPDVIYITQGLIGEYSPRSHASNSVELEKALANLRGSWPTEDNACLVWFNWITRAYLLTLDELALIAHMSLIAEFEDGYIYSITRKPDTADTAG